MHDDKLKSLFDIGCYDSCLVDHCAAAWWSLRMGRELLERAVVAIGFATGTSNRCGAAGCGNCIEPYQNNLLKCRASKYEPVASGL